MNTTSSGRSDSTPHPDPSLEFDALRTVIAALQALPGEARQRIIESVTTFLNIGTPARRVDSRPTVDEHGVGMSHGGWQARTGATHAPFAEDTPLSPKEFILEKQPRTDVERVSCLAYYLTHYRATPHFKTIDLSLLNTEAAQPKFSNAAYSTNNAVKLGYLVPSTKGQRQLSAIGERFVRALPDREAAKAALETMRRRSRPRRGREREQGAEE